MSARRLNSFFTCWLTAAAVCGAMVSPAPVAAQPHPSQQGSAPASGLETSSIERWIEALESDNFHLRERATLELERAGRLAIHPLAEAVAGGQPETVTRGIRVLSQLARSDDLELAGEASAELERLEDVDAHPIARYAAKALESLIAFRRDRALVRLESLGMRRTLVRNIGPFTPVPSVGAVAVLEVDEHWTGTVEDLTQLRHIKDITNLSLYGPQVNDEWLAAIASAEHLRVLKLHRATISAEGLRHLVGLTQLEELNLMHVRLAPDAVDVLMTLPALSRLALFGAGLEPQVIEPLNRLRLQLLDVRRGGFMGVAFARVTPNLPAGMVGCPIGDVRPGGPAETSGLRAGDVIVRVDGSDVVNHQQVIELVGDRSPGDHVAIDVYRLPWNEQSSPIRIDVVLGEWP